MNNQYFLVPMAIGAQYLVLNHQRNTFVKRDIEKGVNDILTVYCLIEEIEMV